MRVLHVVSSLGTYGAERFVAILLERFDRPGIEMGVLTVTGDVPEGASYPIFTARRRGRFDVLFLARMVTAIRRWRPDVVHTHTHHGKYWGRLAAVAACVPAIVHTEHNSEFGAPPPLRLVNRALLSRTAAVVTFSSIQCDRLAREERVPASKLKLIPNGIELLPRDGTDRRNARALLGAGEDDVLILSVGRLAAVKNQRLAIETLAALGVPRARLILVGDGRDRESLERLALARGVAERVTFLGYRSDAARLIAGADVALITSLNEAMPLSVIEAMNAGAPLVSVPWAGACEMLGGGTLGVVSASYDAADLARTVRAVLADRPAADERARNAFVHARRTYDIMTSVHRHAELYRALLPCSPSAANPPRR